MMLIIMMALLTSGLLSEYEDEDELAFEEEN